MIGFYRDLRARVECVSVFVFTYLFELFFEIDSQNNSNYYIFARFDILELQILDYSTILTVNL